MCAYCAVSGTASLQVLLANAATCSGSWNMQLLLLAWWMLLQRAGLVQTSVITVHHYFVMLPQESAWGKDGVEEAGTWKKRAKNRYNRSSSDDSSDGESS